MEEISVKLNEFPTIHVSLGNVNISQHPKPTSHSLLEDRDDSDQHPISAITGLSDALDLKIEQRELDSAVDSALGEAKDRGDFDGKSAYEYAKDAGYAGSEADFAEKLAADCSSVHIGPSAPEKDADLWIDTDEEPEKEEINIPTPDFAASEDEDGHILNRTHFVDKDGVVHKLDNKYIDADWMATSEEHIATAEVIREQKVTSTWSDLQYTLQPGIEYDVIINDVVYPCVAWGSGAVQLGNNTSLSKNNYPFCVYWAGGTATMGMFFYDKNVFSSPIYLKVTEHSWTDYNKLPEGFLPECVVKSVNGITPDENGNVEIEVSGGGAEVSSVEPLEDDIPKVFFGGALQQTKDEAVVPFRYISKTEDISGYAEIKAQGNSSMSYPKKNQTVKLFKDAECTEKLKVDFKGWGKQNKFCFKANWIDLTHARNVVSARLWADVVKSRANYAELPELLRTTPNQGAMDGFPIKVYANGVYQGRYTLNIPKDKWAFNMDDDLDNHCVLCGENYASGCFRAAANINESDWTDEIHDTVPTSIKTRWNEVISFVMNSTDEDFKANLGNYFDVDSLIDYHLFGLASCGFDAYGKNQLYLTYDGQKWIASMYDMDSTWGLYWNGSKFVATDYPRTSYEDYVSGDASCSGEGNLLYNRLEALFYEKLQARWAELRNGVLTIDNVINRFERFTDIASADLVKEDYASTTGGGKFTGIPSQSTNNIQQIRAYAIARLVWTDEYVENLTPAVPVPCTGITLSTSTLTFTAEGRQTLTATVTPDGCTDAITWESDNQSIATVVGGVVTAVANGSCNITAYCGEYSASCAVSVSGIVEPVPCTGITLNQPALTFTGAGSQTLTATATPNGCTDVITWESDNEAIAKVENGIVTAVGNGSCNITVRCGNYSASCTVSVSGIVELTRTYTVELDVEGGIATDTTGENVTMSNFHTSNEYLDIEGFDYVTVINTEYLVGIAFYDSEETFVLNNANKLYANGKTVYAIPDGVKYCRVCMNATGGNTAVVKAYETDAFITLPVTSWSAEAKGNISNAGVITETGSDSYVCEITELPDGAFCLIVENTNGASYMWKKVALYNSAGTFISISHDGGVTTPHIVRTVGANAFAIAVFPNNLATNNAPAEQIAVRYLVE